MGFLGMAWAFPLASASVSSAPSLKSSARFASGRSRRDLALGNEIADRVIVSLGGAIAAFAFDLRAVCFFAFVSEDAGLSVAAMMLLQMKGTVGQRP